MIDVELTPPMSEQERRDLEAQAGRLLTEGEATAYRLRCLTETAVAALLDPMDGGT